MKVLALGGSGGMGRYAVQYLHNIKQIEKIYVADVSSLSAKKFASHFDNRVEGLKLDIRDFETLKSEMSKVDIEDLDSVKGQQANDATSNSSQSWVKINDSP